MSYVAQIIFSELKFEVARSGGPGGQHVNKTNSAVILRWNVSETQSFNQEKKEILIRKLANRLSTEGELIIRSEEYRHQSQNKDRCFEKLDNILQEAFFIPKPRRKTKPTYGSKQKRLGEKKKHSENKKLRKKVNLD
jgi:ribosome-associated protein